MSEAGQLIEVNGVKLFVRDTGGEGPVVLFTHGIFFDCDMFDAQVAALKDQYRCVRFDWRSQGRSEQTLGGHDVDNLAADAVALIEQMDLKPLHWVGLSIGGVIGIRIAAQRPELLRSLTAIGASAQNETLEKLKLYEEIILDGYAVQGPEAIIDRLMPIMFGPDFMNDPDRAELRVSCRQRIIDNDPVVLARASAPILRRVDIRYMLPHVKTPALVMTGEHDAANGPDKSNVIHEGIAGSRQHILPRAGHTPCIEEPDALNDLLREFLSG